MSLLSWEYAVLLLTSVVLYYLFPKKYRFTVLLIANYVFYYLSSSKLIIFLLISTISIYISGLLIGKQNKRLNIDLPKDEKKLLKENVKHQKRIIVLVTILINFGILIVLKYINLLGSGVNGILHLFTNARVPNFNFILPLGISYYTLQAVSYVVDVYRGKYEPTNNLVSIALFTSFFPLITEGPICKYDELADQLYQPNNFKWDNIMEGLTRILVGVLKKMVIADRAAIFVNSLFGSTAKGPILFLAAIMYTVQIYAEFSGCMDIVLGSAKMFGIKLTENFRQPFFSKNVQEFWQRWHITLGAWIKEYIFYPVSLSKMSNRVCTYARKHLKPFLSKFIAIAFPLLFVWLFNGLWHGASIKYIAYGMYYYLIMMLGVLFTPLFNKINTELKINIESPLYKLQQILRTCLFVIIGMMLFRSHSLSTFCNMFVGMFQGNNTNILSQGLVIHDFIVMAIGILILFIVGLFKEKGHNLYEEFKKLNSLTKVFFYLIAVIIIIVYGIYGPGYDASDFIYGQF